MSDPFLSEIRIVSFDFAPRLWALCDGQIMQINQNPALFSLIGTTYGGDGRVNFALPDLRGRVPLHFGNSHTLGERSGEENHTLITNEMPAHFHGVSASSAAPNRGLPTGNMWASATGAYSSSSPDCNMNPASIGNTGGGQAHTNLQPFLVLNFIIALSGIYPPRD